MPVDWHHDLQAGHMFRHFHSSSHPHMWQFLKNKGGGLKVTTNIVLYIWQQIICLHVQNGCPAKVTSYIMATDRMWRHYLMPPTVESKRPPSILLALTLNFYQTYPLLPIPTHCVLNISKYQSDFFGVNLNPSVESALEKHVKWPYLF